MDHAGKSLLGKINRKQIFSVIGLIVLTVFLICFFKSRSLNLIVNDQKSSLVSFYTKNLRSLFDKSPITKEDVLNFALYKELPLDKNNNQFIHLGSRNGENYFEFRKFSETKGTDSYNMFVSKLNLNPLQKKQIDSLLEMYKSKIEDKILVNDKNTIALNSNLWQMNEALLADVLMFTSNINSNVLADVLPVISASSRNAFPGIISRAKASADSNFIFVTPDSIFVMPYDYEHKLHAELRDIDKEFAEVRKEYEVNIDFQKNMDKWKKQNQEKFKFNIDSDHFRVEMPPIPEIPVVEIPDMAELSKAINKAVEEIRITTSGTTRGRPNFKYNYSNSDDTSNFELNISLPDIPALIQNSLEIAGDSLNASLNSVDWEAFGEKMDSLGRAIEEASGDMKKEELRQLKKELKKLKTKAKETRVN